MNVWVGVSLNRGDSGAQTDRPICGVDDQVRWYNCATKIWRFLSTLSAYRTGIQIQVKNLGTADMYTDNDRVMALAGVYQAAWLTQQVARRGVADTEAITASLESLFKIDADDVESIFGGVSGVSLGLRKLHRQLSGSEPRDLELTRYIVALMHLERKLAKQPSLLQRIADEIADATRRRDHFSLLHPNTLAHLADTYKQTVSTLAPKIIVKGEPLHLQNPDNTNRIRALLLAGIRAAMLWRQVGGSRTQVFFRGKIQAALAKGLLDQQ